LKKQRLVVASGTGIRTLKIVSVFLLQKAVIFRGEKGILSGNELGK